MYLNTGSFQKTIIDDILDELESIDAVCQLPVRLATFHDLFFVRKNPLDRTRQFHHFMVLLLNYL